MSVIPAVLLNALREYSFVGSPLWRMSDGKDLVRVELTFHQNLPTQRLYKKGAINRRQPAPSAGEWPSPAHLPTTTRPTPARRSTPCVEKQTPPPPAETTRHYKIHHHTRPHAEDSHHRDSTNHRSTTNTASYSRQPAEEEDTDEVTNSARQ